MKLTFQEKRMLSGEEGDLLRVAMNFLVDLGEAYDAEKMLDISYANILLASSFWGQGNLTRELVSAAIAEGTHVRVPTTFNNWGDGCPFTPKEVWDNLEVPITAKELVMQENEIARQLGVIPTCTCAPYIFCDTSWFPVGANISTAESSAIVYFNSVLGARTNRDCVASFFAALTGKYPAYGYHLDQNRGGVYHFDVQTKISEPVDYGLLGIFAGKICGIETPVFSGLTRPRMEDLRELSAALASSGGVTLFHIVGVTPEAPDLETAFRNCQPRERIVVTNNDLEATRQHLSDADGEVDFVCVGCPHYSIYEMKAVADLLVGKEVSPNVTLWVCTSPQTVMFAEQAGYAATIRRAGAVIMDGPNFCPLFGPGKPGPEYAFAHPDYSVGKMATDASKQAFYARSNLRAKMVFLGSREDCIQAALTGEWRRN